jgi:hypothetical protein
MNPDTQELGPDKAFDFSQCLRRYNVPPGYHRKPFISADTETEGLGGRMIIGGYAHSDDPDETITYFHTAKEWLQAIFDERNEGYIWYVHNGGEYDFKYLIPDLKAMQQRVKTMSTRVICSGDRVIGFKIRYRNHNYELRDSYALMPEGLGPLTAKLCPDYHKLDIGLKDGVIFDEHNAEHMAYFRMDILGLLHAVDRFVGIVWDIFGVPVGWTAPATALMAWRHTLSNDDFFWRQHKKAEVFFRAAYYGGLVFLRNCAEVEDCTSVDFNSMYPSVMRDFGVPVGPAIHTYDRYDERPGIYHVIAHVPLDFPFTMIPYKDKGNVRWPPGDFDTYITRHEMLFAEQYGATFEVIEGYIFKKEAFIFTEFINLCERERVASGGTGIDKVVKIMQNGLYGKFGSRDTIETFSIRVDDGHGEWTQRHDNDNNIIDGLYYKPEKVTASYIQPHWAAWITSRARVKIAQAVMAIGPDEVFYGDTDSITASTWAIDAAVERGDLTLGRTYGILKKEHHYKTFWAGGPKNYQGILDENDPLNAGDIAAQREKYPDRAVFYVDKAKGMPKTVILPEQHRLALGGEAVSVDFQGMSGTLALLKHPELPLVSKRSRSYSKLENSAGWQRGNGSFVVPKPVTMTEDDRKKLMRWKYVPWQTAANSVPA